MYRVTIEFSGVPPSAGPALARDITEDFRQHYPHEHNVICAFDGETLTLVAENDYDSDGLNLMDEFSDVITANSAELFDGEMKLIGVDTIH